MNELQEITAKIKELRRKVQDVPLHLFANRDQYHELRVELDELLMDLRQCHKTWELTGTNFPV